MRRILVTSVLALGLATAAEAGPITVSDFIGVNVTYIFRGTTYSALRLGSVMMSNGSGISPAIDGLTFEAYCVDIFGPIFDAGTPQPPAVFDATASSMTLWTDTYVGPGPRLNAGAQAAWMYLQFVQDAATNGDVSRTGLQMALWNVLYDTDFTVDHNAAALFSVDPASAAVASEANRYLQGLANNLVAANLSDATWLLMRECAAPTCRDIQDFVGPAARPAVVPEASTTLLMMSAAGGLAFLRRRRVKR